MGTATEPEPLRRLCLLQELGAAGRLLQRGLGELQGITTANDFYDLPMLLLGTGFERLMKCVLCLAHLSARGVFPANSTLREFGHDLGKLLDAAIAQCCSDSYPQRPAAAADLEYLQGDDRLRRVVEWLSDFARAARYYRLDVVTGAPTAHEEAPDTQWARIENSIVADLVLVDRMLKEPSYDPYTEIMPVLIADFERWARALVRLLTLSKIADTARPYATDPALTHFLFLRDEDLGKTDYRTLR